MIIKFLIVLLLFAIDCHAFNFGFNFGGNQNTAKYEDIISSLSISPTSKDYGSQNTGTNTDQVFTITCDSGTFAGSCEEITKAASGVGYSIVDTNCATEPFDLSPGGNCTVTVRFSPASAGTLNGSVDLVWPNQATKTASLTGVGVSTGCSTTPTVSYTAGSTTDIAIGYSDNRTSLGNQYAGGSTYNACSVGFYMKIGAGTVTGKTYVAKVYTASANNANLGTLKGTSTTVSGSVLTSTAAEVKFAFSPAVAVTTNDVVIVTTSDNSRDGSNYAQLQYGSGLANWSWNQYDFNRVFYTDDGTKTMNFKIYE